MTYINNFVKEVLRVESGDSSFTRMAHEEIHHSSGLIIPKNTFVRFSMQGCNYHEEEWINPYEFLPERHDPASELFKTPSGGKRSNLAFNPFGFGLRGCPGKSLG